MAQGRLVDPDLAFIREIRQAGGDTLKKCYQCATCSTVCNLSPDDRPFPRKEMLMAGWGQSKELAKDPDVWLCYQCNDCTTYCPRSARPGDVLAAIRSYSYKHYAFPAFMGRALANPRALPLLILVPILILLACIQFTAPRGEDDIFDFLRSNIIDFNTFPPHSSVDALFVFGNIMIFIFASVGFLRFWRMLRTDGTARQMSFIPAALLTLKEIFVHNRFRECGANHPRAIGHMLLFFGFAGAMATTGAVFVFIFAPHYLMLLGFENLHAYFELPFHFMHPVKILGAVSGLALLIGSGMLLVRRWTNRDEVGANGYSDYLFLYVLFLAGLSGLLAWLTRLSGIVMLAYVNYFIHIVCVYFLLWYMPYSKFAHMFYRGLAIVHARSIGRVQG
jgi:quinone-modifying oxidoreductase subunit QmoC